MDPFLQGPPYFPRMIPNFYSPYARELNHFNYMKYLYFSNYFSNFQFAMADMIRHFSSGNQEESFSSVLELPDPSFMPGNIGLDPFSYPPNFIPNMPPTISNLYLHDMIRNINNMINNLNSSQREGMTALRNAIFYFDANLNRSRERLRQLSESFDREIIDITDQASKPDRLTKEQINAIPCLIYQGVKKITKSKCETDRTSENKVMKISKKIKKQPKVSVTSEPTSHRTCCICITDYKKGQTLRDLGCKHRFHRRCIDIWLARKNICPICNTRVKPIKQQQSQSN